MPADSLHNHLFLRLITSPNRVKLVTAARLQGDTAPVLAMPQPFAELLRGKPLLFSHHNNAQKLPKGYNLATIRLKFF